MNFDSTLLNIFAAEQAEHVGRMRAAIGLLSSESLSSGGFEELLRRAHTFKGAARAVGLDATERTIHALESALEYLRGSSDTPNPDVPAILHGILDFTEDVLAAAFGRRAEPNVEDVLRRIGSLTGRVEESLISTSTIPIATVETEDLQSANEFGEALIRVDAKVLDAMLQGSSQLLNRAAVAANTTVKADRFATWTEETIRNYERLRNGAGAYIRSHSGDPDFEPLAQCISYIDQHAGALVAGARDAAVAVQQHSWTLFQDVQDLRDTVSRARMIPADSAFGPFGAMVRALAEQEGKHILFRADGLEVNVDRLVLQALKDPVMHLLRNAVSHGVESSELRRMKGKSSEGTIRLAVQSQGDQFSVVVEDDGAGLDLDALTTKAVSKGLLSPAQVGELGIADKAAFIFEPGFSTATNVSNLSGRGMGLAIVKDAVARLFGSIRVHPRTGGGTQFVITAPLSISTQHVVIVRAEDHVVAISAAFTEAVGRWRPNQVKIVNSRECIEFKGEAVPLVDLADLLQTRGPKQNEDGELDGEVFQAVIFSDAGARTALVVTEIVGSQEATVRESGLSPSNAGWSSGAIPLEDGSVATLLNLTEPVRAFLRSPGTPARSLAVKEERRRCRILVVDDSITTRSLERSILEAHGYQVELAVDGLDAWNKIHESAPDLVISDVSMPRMNGFELLENIKANKATANIPVILVSSLESSGEQERGLSLGADAYIVKRKFEQKELLSIVRQIL